MTYEARSRPNIAMAARRGACFGAVTAVSVWICSESRAGIATFLDDARLIYQNGDRYTKGTARRSRNRNIPLLAEEGWRGFRRSDHPVCAASVASRHFLKWRIPLLCEEGNAPG